MYQHFGLWCWIMLAGEALLIRRIGTRKEDLDIEVRYNFSQYRSFMNLFRIPGTTSSVGPMLRLLLAMLVVADHTLHLGDCCSIECERL
jgi:hypothetical protein